MGLYTYPIAYTSRTLQQHEKNTITQIEPLRIVWAVERFHHNLYGRHCVVSLL